MVTAIRNVHGHNYGHGEGAAAFGIASGGSDDWAHDSGVPLRNVFIPKYDFSGRTWTLDDVTWSMSYVSSRTLSTLKH